VVRVPIAECFSDEESAKARADEKANELIAVLVQRIDELKQPAALLDKTQEVT
jgi:hypothetical protein